MISLDELRAWHEANYPDAGYRDVAIKVGEEAGEVLRAVDRITYDYGPESSAHLADEAGDLVIALARLLDLFDLDLEQAVDGRWAEVRTRTRNRTS